jgi:hypothetical protein
MGGWVVAHTAASDKGLTGAIMISVANMGRIGDEPRDRVLALMAGDLESLAGVTAESMADELRHSAKAFRMENTAAGLSQIPLLVLTSDDGYGPDANTLVGAIEAKGGRKVTAKHFATDHVWSDRRITLESEIIKWLTELHDEGH